MKDGAGFPNGHNRGLSEITGEYFSIVDADDYIDCDYIEKLYNALESEDADVSMAVNDLVWDEGRCWHEKRTDKAKIVISGEEIKKLPHQLLNSHSNRYYGDYIPEIGAYWLKLIKTSIIREHRITFNPDLHIWVDWVFMMEIMMRINKFVFITTTQYHFNQSEGSETRRSGLNVMKLRKTIRVMDSMHDVIKQRMDSLLEEALMKFYMRCLYDISAELCRYWNESNNEVIQELVGEIKANDSVRHICNYNASDSDEFSYKDIKLINIWRNENTLILLRKNEYDNNSASKLAKYIPAPVKRLVNKFIKAIRY